MAVLRKFLSGKVVNGKKTINWRMIDKDLNQNSDGDPPGCWFFHNPPSHQMLFYNNKDGKVCIKSHDHKPYFGSIDCLQRIVKEEGAFKLYAGLRGALFKAFITNFVFYFFKIINV